ncbi:unnamed protein product [Discosporangium mesarthrocarpum]
MRGPHQRRKSLKFSVMVEPMAEPRGTGDRTPPQSRRESLIRSYMIVYNLFSARGWFSVVFNMGLALVGGQGVNQAVNSTLRMVQTMQLLATVEFVHVFLGLVKSNPVNLLMQTGGRDLALFAVITAIPETRDSPWVLLTFVAWGLSELIRFPYYSLTLVGQCPPFLHWLRYTAFIVLYPMGFMGELGAWLVGIPHMKASGLYTIPGLPGGAEIWILYAYLLFAFVFGAPKLYLHMLKQRAKQLRQGSGGGLGGLSDDKKD